MAGFGCAQLPSQVPVRCARNKSRYWYRRGSIFAAEHGHNNKIDPLRGQGVPMRTHLSFAIVLVQFLTALETTAQNAPRVETEIIGSLRGHFYGGKVNERGASV
jgi:hypothetical protein